MESEKLINKDVRNAAENDKQVIAVLLFGSLARGEPHRDVDICIILDKKYDNLTMSKKRLYYASLAKKDIDVHIFQQLPYTFNKES